MKLFECGIRYDKTMDDGIRRRITELYIVDALSFTEAEKRISKEIEQYISAFEVVSEKITNYTELVRNAGDGGKWYKVKNNLVSLDEKTGKKKKMPVYLLIEAKDTDDARATLENFMKGTISDWQCESIQETKILDVFTFDVTSAQ